MFVVTPSLASGTLAGKHVDQPLAYAEARGARVCLAQVCATRMWKEERPTLAGYSAWWSGGRLVSTRRRGRRTASARGEVRVEVGADVVLQQVQVRLAVAARDADLAAEVQDRLGADGREHLSRDSMRHSIATTLTCVLPITRRMSGIAWVQHVACI